MILAIRYTVKGVKKGYKKYKDYQAEKEEAARGTLPDLHDPSRELDVSCQAERTRSNSTESKRLSKDSNSTLEAEKALEDDPEFQKYMDKHRHLYLQQQKSLPPKYEAAIAQNTTPISATSSGMSPRSPMSESRHCTCHNCMSFSQHTSPVSANETHVGAIQEMPASTTYCAELEVPEIYIHKTPSQQSVDQPVIFEVPGDLPAIIPEKKKQVVSELS